MNGLWWPVLVAVVGMVILRRWWMAAIGIALIVGTVVAGLHVSALPTYDIGSSRVLTVRLQEMPRTVDGQWGGSWIAAGEVEQGGPRARVSIGGRGTTQALMGDRITARMVAGASNRPGNAASLWVRGEAVTQPDTGTAAAVRARMRTVAGDSDAGWLLSGMTLGLDQGLSQRARADMTAAGLTHLTAVSGANCAVLLLVVNWICGWVRLRRVARALVGGTVLLAFVVVVGQQPSILRAAVMAGLALGAGLVGGRRAAAHVLQVAVIALLLIDPWLAYSVGFMLSVAATAGLIAVVDRGPLAATMAAQVATLPILLGIGAQVGLRSILANMLVTPVVAVVPILGLVSLAVPVVAAPARGLCHVVLLVAGWRSFGPLPWVPGWAGVALAVLVSLAVLVLGRRHFVLVAVVLVGVVSLTARLADGWPPPGWWLVACDVGQGDGFIIREGGRVIVVDTGPQGDAMNRCLDRLGVGHIDLLVLTHFHADHVGGLAEVLGGRAVGQVWVSLCTEPADTAAEALPLLKHLPVVVPAPGAVVPVGDMVVRVVWPQRVIEAGSVPNNASVSFLLTSPRGSVAFLGDVEREAQSAILASADIDADIAKVPHHGSANFHPALPAAVSARLALVGVGHDNTFGHPSQEAIAAWQASGAQVLTTSDNGDIAVVTDGSVVVRGSVD